MFYVYIIENSPKCRWYIGFSSDLKKRIAQHNRGENRSTSYSRSWKLIYYEAYLNRKDALGREKFLKSGSGWKFLKKQMRHYLAD